jgi:hypothetical protein
MIELNWINSGYTWTATHDGDTFEVIEESCGYTTWGPDWLKDGLFATLEAAQDDVAEKIHQRSVEIQHSRCEELQAFYRGWERV